MDGRILFTNSNKNYVEHHCQEKWEDFFNTDIDWPKVWEALNNPITSEQVKTTIWEQIHLNDYCTYSYNKWHKNQERCPLCLSIPLTKYHLTLECELTKKLWNDLEHRLMCLLPNSVSDQENIFGLLGHSPNIILRNWITFLLRQCIVDQERIAYHNKKGPLNEFDIKRNLNEKVKTEIMEKYRIFSNLGRNAYFEKVFTVNDFMIIWQNNWWQVLTLYKL